MNNIIMPFIISTLAGLSTIIGSLFVFLKIDKKSYNKYITFCLSFSAAIMIGISIFDLIPESFFLIYNEYGIFNTIILLISSLIISYIIITILSNLLNKENNTNYLYKLGILNMIVLILHNLPEGIATFLSSYQNISLGLRLSIAIMLHNIPEGISIAVPIYYATGSLKKAFKATFISGIAEPIGAILSLLFLKNYMSDTLISTILIVVAGLMITLSIEELIPRSIKYKENKYLYLGLLIGLTTIIINVLFF